MRFLLNSLLLLCPLFAGCAKYDYDITQPASARLRITADGWQHLDVGPISYRFRAAESHLVVQIYNSTPDPIRILGDRSYIVTPAHQSISLDTQSIASGAFVKLILPPMPQVIRQGPSIGFGLGYSTGRADSPAFAGPSLLSIENPNNDWDWNGESDVTLHMVFEQSDKIFDQTYVFHRIKL